jgi:hypothetical protein
MTYYRSLYGDSERWNGVEDLEGKRIVVYCEQGVGDILQFVRYVPYLKQRGCHVILHCPASLHRLFLGHLDGVDEVLDREEDAVPPHNFHVLSMSLPFVLQMEQAAVPYIKVTDKMVLPSEFDRCFKIGIAWEGNPNHSNNLQRSCHLEYFREIHDIPNVKLFMLQNTINRPEYLEGAEDLEIYGSHLSDYLETATLINAMDTVAVVDTSVVHLAGAMNKPGYCLLSKPKDPRWNVANWYDSIVLTNQMEEGVWVDAFDTLFTYITFEMQKLGRL